MPLKITRRAPGWEGNIIGGSTITLRIPIGLTTHQVYTEYAFVDADSNPVALADAVDEIRVVLNGQPVWNILASELDTKNQYEGRAAAAGILTLDFDRYNMRSRPAEEFTSIGTGAQGDPTPITTFVVEMTLKAGVQNGQLTSYLRQSESRPLGLFKKLRRYPYQFSAAGTFDVADLPKGDLINAVYFFESANDIDRVVLERDNFIMFDRTKELNSRIQSDGVRTPQENLFVYDTAEDGNGTDQLVTAGVNDLRFRLTVDGAMTCTALVEYIGALER